MESRAGRAFRAEPESEELREIVPARAVLTELARGFLLDHESNPQRALLFAETFLKEQTGRMTTSRAEPVGAGRVTRARLDLGRFPRGAVEPPPPSKPPDSA